MVLQHQNGDLVVMKILAPDDNVEISLKVLSLHMIVDVDIIKDLSFRNRFFLTKQQNRTIRHTIISTYKVHC